MKIKDRVKIKDATYDLRGKTYVQFHFGEGTIIDLDISTNWNTRWLVKLDSPPENFINMQNKQGGLCFNENELIKI